jgi:hypothetical protein
VCLIQLPPLRLRFSLNVLRGAVAGWYVWVTTRRGVCPFMAEGSQAEGALGHGRCRRVTLMLG